MSSFIQEPSVGGGAAADFNKILISASTFLVIIDTLGSVVTKA